MCSFLFVVFCCQESNGCGWDLSPSPVRDTLIIHPLLVHPIHLHPGCPAKHYLRSSLHLLRSNLQMDHLILGLQPHPPICKMAIIHKSLNTIWHSWACGGCCSLPSNFYRFFNKLPEKNPNEPRAQKITSKFPA